MKQPLTTHQIMEIHQLSTNGYSSGAIAAQMNLGLSVVKKWRSRTCRGIFTPGRRGRKARGPLSDFAPELRSELLALRDSQCGMGPIQLLIKLRSDPHWQDHQHPSRSSVARLLRSEGLSRSYQRHGGVVCQRADQPEHPHDCWQMDAKGNHSVEGVGTTALINLKDWYSRTYCMTYPAVVKGPNGHPNTSDYQNTLRLAFLEFGMPKALQVDHESIFFENRSKSPFPTRFHLWLIALGITLRFSRKGRPTDNAIVERSHQTTFNHIVKGRSFEDWFELMRALDQQRVCLNQHTPCASLENRAPFEAFPDAKLIQRPFDPDQEHRYMDLQRVYHYLKEWTWYRETGTQKTVHLGGQVYYLKQAQPHQTITISFDRDKEQLRFCDDKERWEEYLSIRNFSKEILSGKTLCQSNRPCRQIPIPFDINFYSMYNRLRINETIPVTI